MRGKWMGMWLLAGAMAMGSAALMAQTSITGDWYGALHTGAGELHLVLHIRQADGGLKATLDSVDQGADGIPVSAVTLKGEKLSLQVEAVHGSYEGTVNADGTEIDGTWTQGTPLALEFRRKGEAAAARSDIDGLWLGKMDTGVVALRMVIRIRNTTSGLTAELQSPDQTPAWFEASSVKRDGDALTMAVVRLGGEFDGKIATDRQSITGTWKQGGREFPLTVRRVKDMAAVQPRRPQMPKKPYPYRSEDVTFANAGAQVTLAGTLTVPRGKGPFPAVLLIAGSGPHDRDETLMGHKPFLVLADYLTRRGIAVLRYDKRGIGKSTGNYGTATTSDFASDAEAGFEYLRMLPEVNRAEVGLVGHSEGGIIAPMVAAEDAKVAFIVMMAGTGVPGDQVVELQSKLMEQANGVSAEQVKMDDAKTRKVVELVKSGVGGAALQGAVREQLGAHASDIQVGTAVKQMETPWSLYFLNYDPATALRKVKCPVLALDGSKDLQVPAEQNLPAIRKALEEGGNHHFEVVEMPGLNHLFQTAKTGLPAEYGEVEETIAPAALKKMGDWILEQARAGAGK